MQIGFQYKHYNGFARLYNYGLKHFNPNNMITKQAEKKVKILEFWKKFGFEATKSAFGAKQSILYLWQKTYKNSGYKIDSLNPKSQARINNNKRVIDFEILKKIKRLRLEICPNMGKAKIKKYLDEFCENNNLQIY